MLNFRISPAHEVIDKENLRNAQSDVQRVTLENTKLRENLRKISLVSEALWRIVKEKLNVSEEDLRKLIDEVGQGKIKALSEPKNCEKCSRPISLQSKRCVFCGTTVKDTEIFPT